jgi:hypothetical protein
LLAINHMACTGSTVIADHTRLLCAVWSPVCCCFVQQFSDVGHSMLTMFTYALGGVELDIMLGSSNPEASIFLSLLYQFAMGTVLMSLLTGVTTGPVGRQ